MSKGVYIHIPFCSRKCNYCSFYSVADIRYKEEFLAALEKEIEHKKWAYPEFFDNSEATLYIGGGNPALLDESEMARLFGLLRKLPFRFTETTIEANPDSITAAKAGLYKKLGINRISVGVQAFDDSILKFLGRNHSAQDALRSLDIVCKYFENFSIDLIGGIPAPLDHSSEFIKPETRKMKKTYPPPLNPQSVFARDWEKEVHYIAQYRPPHLSFYLLSIEKGSEFYGKVQTDEDEQGRDYELFCANMPDMDYEHYEISNFCRPGYSCTHNEAYWERNEYMGFGPSAVSFVKGLNQDSRGASQASAEKSQGVKESSKKLKPVTQNSKPETHEMRIKNVSNIHSYIKVPALSELERLNEEDSFFETVFLSLRTNKGLDLINLESKFSERTAGIEGGLLRLGKSGFVEKFNGKWIIPEKHLIISNEIVVELMKETEYA